MNEYMITYAATVVILGGFLLIPAMVWLLMTQHYQDEQLWRMEWILRKLEAKYLPKEEDETCDSN